MFKSPTRGKGLLEPILARLRADRAEKCIPDTLRSGRILDIGCGANASFLHEIEFNSKYGVDQLPSLSRDTAIAFTQVDLNARPQLPFEDAYFSVVTMLAVVEHLDPAMVPRIFEEVYRVLDRGGRLILTMPAPWSDPLLRGMARIGLVSSAEIDEHQNVLGLQQLISQLREVGFSEENIESGYFELGLNTWAAAAK